MHQVNYTDGSPSREVEENHIKVEIGQFKPVDKGAFKASFTLLIYPYGQKIFDCKYFNNGTNTWFSFPSKEIKKQDGSKSDFFPLITYLDKTYQAALQEAVLKELKLKAWNGEYNQPQSRKPDSIQGEASYLPF